MEQCHREMDKRLLYIGLVLKFLGARGQNQAMYKNRVKHATAQIRLELIFCLHMGQKQLTYRFVLGNVNNQSHGVKSDRNDFKIPTLLSSQ